MQGWILFSFLECVCNALFWPLWQELEPWLFIAEPQQRSHIWSAESFMHYLDFLAQEVRERRKALHLKHTDAALIICDNASQHASSKFRAFKEEWMRTHNAVPLNQAANTCCLSSAWETVSILSYSFLCVSLCEWMGGWKNRWIYRSEKLI